MTEIHNLPRSSLLKRVHWYEKKYGPYTEKKGTHNWKNLFKKPTLHEWTILAMLVLALFLWWAYTYDMESCRIVVAECNAILNPDLDATFWYNLTVSESINVSIKDIQLVEVNNVPGG